MLPRPPVPLRARLAVWTGGSSNAWANGANWLGGNAPSPSSSIGTLTFEKALDAINFSENNLSGLSVNSWQINDGHEYLISGEPLSLGSGGLTITAPELSAPFTGLAIPLTLTSSQRWQFSGGGNPEGQHVTIGSAVSGETANLTIGLSGAATWTLLGGFPGSSPSIDDELGNVTVEGSSDSVFELGAALNSADGHSVTLKDVNFYASSVTMGPLISEAARVHVALQGLEQFGPAILTVQRVSLDGGSSLAFAITSSGDQAGKDYSQIQSSGSVDLGGASLELYGTCPSLPVGEVLTLISTTGSLSGSFSNAANGSVVNCGAVHYQINYHTTGSPQTVTATVVMGSEPSQETNGGSTGNQQTSGQNTTAQTPASSPAPPPSNTSTPSSGSVSLSQVKTSLLDQLVPSGKAATITALLKHDGLAMTFRALEAGTLVVGWYEVASGAKPAKHGKARPVLVGSGQMSFPGAGTGKIKVRLTAAGRRLLKHSKRLTLEAKEAFTPKGKTAISVIKALVVYQ
jgi:hypothetical protein